MLLTLVHLIRSIPCDEHHNGEEYMLLLALIGLSILILALIVRDIRSARRVPHVVPLPNEQQLPATVSVIVPARNEARNIGRCLAGLAAQPLPGVQVIVLDDNSADATGEIARSFAERVPGLRVLAGEPLPPGWAGKCWACWRAAEHSTGEWLLFLDADTAPQPGIITALLKYAVAHHCDMVTALPYIELGSFWERVLMPPFAGLIQAVIPLDKVNDPQSPHAMANGQCILMRRDVYFAVDGHRAVRDSVLEDVRLAQTIKGAGYRIAVVAGPDLLHVRMYTNGAEVAEGLHKNAAAGARATGGLRTVWAGFRQTLLATAPTLLVVIGLVLAALGGTDAWLFFAFGAGLLVVTVSYWGYVVSQLHRLNPAWAIFYPFGTMCYFMLATAAMISVARGRGVVWKGRRYAG